MLAKCESPAKMAGRHPQWGIPHKGKAMLLTPGVSLGRLTGSGVADIVTFDTSQR